MPLHIVRNDITKMKVDAIVNAANNSLLGGGGVDGAIHQAAGPSLLEECISLGGCETGSAKITGAGNLSAKHVIHTVGPRWFGGDKGEKEKLISCYSTCLELAKENGCESVAFPLISAGAYGYPKKQALRVALDTVETFLQKNEMIVYIVVFDKASYHISESLFDEVSSYIDDNYIDEIYDEEIEREDIFFGRIENVNRRRKISSPKKSSYYLCEGNADTEKASLESPLSMELDDAFENLDESFAEMLLRKIDEKGMTDAQCYKKANIDRRLFAKIRNDRLYRPSKSTAIAFAIALELSLTETDEFLRKAGFALSRVYKFDVIIEYFIKRKRYNVNEINETLFAFDQSLLGA